MAMMDLKLFWDLVNWSLRPTKDEQQVALRDELKKLPPNDILDFALRYDEREGAAYKGDIWAAAYLIQGGCSDDGFIDFLNWLVGLGSKVYDAALANPDTLADVVDGEDVDDEGVDGAPWAAWLDVTGRTERDYAEELQRRRPPWKGSDEGEHWWNSDEEELRRRFPRLAALYLDDA
jgi:hypothetical protein